MHRQMRYFMAVVETNSFFEAGELCHVSQSAVSQQIKALEEELGAALLERHGRKFNLTPAGRYFYEQAKRHTNELDAIIRETRRIDSGEYQHLRIGVLHGFSPAITQQAADRFARSHPNVRLSLTTGTHEELFHSVNEGTSDLVVNDQWRALSDRFINDELMEQPLFAMIRHDHPICAAGNVSAEDLQHDFCILVTSPAQRGNEAAHGRDILGLMSDFLFVDNVESARMNAAAGAGYYLCGGDAPPAAGTVLLPVMQSGNQISRRFFAFWPESVDSPLHWEFTDALHAVIR